MYTFTNSKSFLKITIPPRSEEIKRQVDFSANMYNKLAYNFPHYYKIYFNVTFIFLITPFRLSFDGKSAKVVTNPIQMVLCAIVHALVGILAFLWIRRDVDSKIRDKPDLLFTIASYISWMFYIFIFAMVFWSKRIFAILNIPYKQSNLMVSLKGILLILLGILTLFMYYGTEVVFDEKFKIHQVLDNFASTSLYMTFQHRNKTEKVIFNVLTTEKKALVLSMFVVDVFYNLIISFLELFGCISTFAAYEVVTSLEPIFHNGKVAHIRVLLQHYADMKEVIGKINQVNGPILLIIFIQIIPWISGSMIDVLDEDKWLNKAYMIFYHLFYLFLLGVASEVYHKAKIFKKRIYAFQRVEMERNDLVNRDLSYVTNFLKGTAGESGLAGGNFFVVTYSFIGTSVSVLMTFCMIMVQFKSTLKNPVTSTTD